MEQNENQYEEIDRKKVAFLIGAILVIAAALLLAVYLFTDATKASTGEGEAVAITPERIIQISDEVTDRVLDTLNKDILADRIHKAVEEQLKGETIYEILSDGDVKVTAVGEDELRDVIAILLEESGISGDGILTDDQKEYIRLAVGQALEDALLQISVSQLLTDEERERLENQLKRELTETLKAQIQNSTGQLTGRELEQLKNTLNIERLIQGEVDKITKQQMQTLKAQILASIKKPVKGVDYFTDADIRLIQDRVLKAAKKELFSQLEKLTRQISEVKTSVNTLTSQVKELKALDKEKTADIKKLQTSITTINNSIQHIHTVTEQLAEAITVSGRHLEKVTGSGSEIRAESVSDRNLTIAEFVDILAGNDQIYTGAIRELNKIVKQLKDENIKQDENFERAVSQLEHSLNDNGKALEDAKAALEKSDQELKNQLQKSDQELRDQLEKDSDSLTQKLEEEKKAREEADEKLREQADAADALTGDPKEAGRIEGDTVFQKIGAIVKILSKDGISGLFEALQGIGGAETVEEGMENLHTDLTDARARVEELEKEKWLSDIVLLAEPQQEGVSGYTYQESGSAYVYQIPLVTESDRIRLEDDDTSVVITFKKPGRLPSHAALSTNGNALCISFANRPSRNIEIVSIHVYKEK